MKTNYLDGAKKMNAMGFLKEDLRAIKISNNT
jgi:hypothetical protein